MYKNPKNFQHPKKSADFGDTGSKASKHPEKENPFSSIKDGKELKAYFGRLDLAFKQCQDEGFDALFIPEIVDERIISERDSLIWKKPFYGLSIKATGKSKQLNKVVIYFHKPHFFCNPKNIECTIQTGLFYGAGIMPINEFYRLCSMEYDEEVFAIDHNLLKHPPITEICIEKALKNPQTIPFLGGKTRAERYFKVYKKFYGNRIRITYEKDFLTDNLTLARFLSIGFGSYPALDSDNDFNNYGWIVGKRKINERE